MGKLSSHALTSPEKASLRPLAVEGLGTLRGNLCAIKTSRLPTDRTWDPRDIEANFCEGIRDLTVDAIRDGDWKLIEFFTEEQWECMV